MAEASDTSPKLGVIRLLVLRECWPTRPPRSFRNGREEEAEAEDLELPVGEPRWLKRLTRSESPPPPPEELGRWLPREEDGPAVSEDEGGLRVVDGGGSGTVMT